jgi:hypothetical protein
VKSVVGIWRKKDGKKMSVAGKKKVITSPNFAVKPSWGGRVCDFQALIFTPDLTGFPL